MAWAVSASPRFPSPLIKPDVRISRIRLSDWLHLEALGDGAKMDPAEPQHAELAKHHLIAGSGGAARRHLVTPDQEVADPIVDVIVDRPVGHAAACHS